MDNLLQKKNRFLYKITSFILIILNLNSLKVNALDPSQINIKQEITNVYSDANDELKQKFQPLVENIFLNRNSAILTRDCEGLKVFYDLDKKVGKWAYENVLLIGVKNNVFHLQK